MSPRAIEAVVYIVGIGGLVAVFALPFFGVTGFRGDLTRFLPELVVPFLFLTIFPVGPFLTRERRRIAAISDVPQRIRRERAFLKKARLLGLAFASAVFAGYFLGHAL